MRVDLPAPLGPSNPTARPRSDPFSPFRMDRPPRTTCKFSSSIIDRIVYLYDALPGLVPGNRMRKISLSPPAVNALSNPNPRMLPVLAI